MEGAIKSAMPDTRHRWCKWHVLRCAKEKLGNVYGKYGGFRHEFHTLINDVLCVAEFEHKWDILIQKYGLSSNTYIENLYANRTK